MYKEPRVFRGSENGPRAVILAGVHGNEYAGIRALEELLPDLKIDRGYLICAFGNPEAIKNKVRFIEADLNRQFKEGGSDTLEKKRAEEIKPWLKEADFLLDVHGSSIKDSRPFIICESQAFEIAKNLPAEIVSHGWDEIEPGGTDYYMNKIGKTGICIECGYNEDPQSKDVAKTAILNFLHTLGMLTTKIEIKPKKQRNIWAKKLYKSKTNFKPSRVFADFEKVIAGEIIGTDGVEEIKALEDGCVIFVHRRDEPDAEAFIFGVDEKLD